MVRYRGALTQRHSSRIALVVDEKLSGTNPTPSANFLAIHLRKVEFLLEGRNPSRKKRRAVISHDPSKRERGTRVIASALEAYYPLPSSTSSRGFSVYNSSECLTQIPCEMRRGGEFDDQGNIYVNRNRQVTPQ